jgi:hypothetical protein
MNDNLMPPAPARVFTLNGRPTPRSMHPEARTPDAAIAAAPAAVVFRKSLLFISSQLCFRKGNEYLQYLCVYRVIEFETYRIYIQTINDLELVKLDLSK